MMQNSSPNMMSIQLLGSGLIYLKTTNTDIILRVFTFSHMSTFHVDQPRQ